jgi:predicted transcriptional regulator
MTKDIQISARVPKALMKQVEKIAAAQGRSKSWAIEKALENYVESEAEFIEAVMEGLADSKAGRTVSYEDVMAEFRHRITGRRK